MVKGLLGGAAVLLFIVVVFVRYSFFKTPESASQPIDAVAAENTAELVGDVGTTYTLVQEASEARFLI